MDWQQSLKSEYSETPQIPNTSKSELGLIYIYIYMHGSVKNLCLLNIYLQDSLLCNLSFELITNIFRINRFYTLEAFPQIGIEYFTLETNHELIIYVYTL